MRETRVTLPEVALIAGTRAALGADLGLLLADRFTPDQRRAVGWTLLLIGALSTIPWPSRSWAEAVSPPTRHDRTIRGAGPGPEGIVS